MPRTDPDAVYVGLNDRDPAWHELYKLKIFDGRAHPSSAEHRTADGWLFDNKREADQIVIALRDRGFPVEYMVAPDEGHGLARPVDRMAMLALAEKFLAKYLGGRYQESLTPEVAKRLQEITVVPKTVKVSHQPDRQIAAPRHSPVE